jgi:hemoglobin
MKSIYETLGEAKIKKIVTLFYESIAEDEVIRPMYPKDLVPAEERLYLFLIQIFGGPMTYSEKRGHPMLRRRHFPYAIDMNASDRWLKAMSEAAAQIEMTEETRTQVLGYFGRAALWMVNR